MPNPARVAPATHSLGLRILREIRKSGDALLSELIEKFAGDDLDAQHSVRQHVHELVNDNLLRMKDSDVDHEWAYRITRSGQRFVESTIDRAEGGAK